MENTVTEIEARRLAKGQKNQKIGNKMTGTCTCHVCREAAAVCRAAAENFQRGVVYAPGVRVNGHKVVVYARNILLRSFLLPHFDRVSATVGGAGV